MPALAEDLVLLAVDPRRRRLFAPALDELCAAGDLGDEVLAGAPLAGEPYRAIRERAGATRGARSDRTLHTLVTAGHLRRERRRRFGLLPVDHVEPAGGARAALADELEAGLRDRGLLPLRLGLLAALACAGGLDGYAHDHTARAVASGEIRLAADPAGAVPVLARELRRALDALG